MSLRSALLGTSLLFAVFAACTAGAAPVLYAAGAASKALRLADGSTIVAGDFASVDGVPRNGLAKLVPAGTLDAAWQPTGLAGYDVVALAASLDGSRVYLATASGVRAVDAGSGASVPGFAVTVSGSADGGSTGLRTLAVDGQDHLYLGGAFAYVNGTLRGGIARLAANGTLDATWAASLGVVNALAIDGSAGFVYAGGDFVVAGTTPHFRLARLALGDAAIDDAWHPLVSANVSGAVQQLALSPAGDAVVVTGNFTKVDGTARNGIARILTANGQLDPSWTPALAGYDIAALALRNGYAYFAGPTLCCTPGFVRRAPLASGIVDNGWTPQAQRRVTALTFDGAGNVDAFGDFAHVDGAPMLGAAVISAAGGAGNALPDFERPGATVALATEASGTLLAAGDFAKADNVYRAGLLRLALDGTLDMAFVPPRFDGGSVNALALDAANGAIYVGGSFTTAGGTPRAHLARLHGADGMLDAAWTPNVTGIVHALAADQGALYVGGQFASVNGTPRANFARLANDGSLDALDLPANGYVMRIAIDGDSVFLLGNFNLVGGYSRLHVAKLLRAGGTVDANWHPTLDWTLQWSNFFDLVARDGIAYLAEQASIPYLGGYLLVGEIVRIDALGTAQPIARFNQPVLDLLLPAEGETLIAGGNFTQQYALGDPFNQTPHAAGFAQISLQPGSLGAAEAWAPAVPPGDTPGLAQLGGGLVVAGQTMPSWNGFARPGIALLAMPAGDRLFRDGFD